MHYAANRKTCRTIEAHSIQRNGTLSRLVDARNHVMCFNAMVLDEEGLAQVLRVGWKEASTFSGFCSVHDAQLFSPIDTAGFVGSPEQCSLVGYRALCHELHQRRSALKAQEYVRRMGDRGLPLDRQWRFQAAMSAVAGGLGRGLIHFERMKELLDDCLRRRDFSQWAGVVLTFSGNLCVAGTGLVSPTRDFSGRELQRLHDPEHLQESLTCSILATDTGGAVVLGWLPNCGVPNELLEDLLARPEDQILTLVVQFMFAHIANMYFSETWWNALRPAQKRNVWDLASIANPYYSEFQYRHRSIIVPWKLASVVRAGDASSGA